MEPDNKLTEEVFKQLLKPDFDMSRFEFEDLVGLGSEIVEHRELYQKVIGKFASALPRTNADLQEFADALENQTGIHISTSTLRHYRWIYEKLGHLDIPEDFDYSTWNALAPLFDPESWVRKAKENGWDKKTLKAEIRKFLNKPPVFRIVQCPHCGKEHQVQLRKDRE